MPGDRVAGAADFNRNALIAQQPRHALGVGDRACGEEIIVHTDSPSPHDMRAQRRCADEKGRALFLKCPSEGIVIQFSVRSSSATACAAIPSPLPVKPRRSSVVAFTLTRETSVSSISAMFARICSR